MEIYEFLAKGGPVMIPILLFSVIALAIFFERLWSLRRINMIPQRFVDMIEHLLGENRIEEAHTLAESNDSAAAQIAESAMRYYGSKRQMIREVLEEEGRRRVVEMEKFTTILSTTAHVTPLLGLLGTVTGMIGVFQQIVIHGASDGNVDASALAGGIWEAMLTTATGLAVAIPAFLAYKYLLSKVDRYAEELSRFGSMLLESLSPSDEQPRQREFDRKKHLKSTDTPNNSHHSQIEAEPSHNPSE